MLVGAVVGISPSLQRGSIGLAFFFLKRTQYLPRKQQIGYSETQSVTTPEKAQIGFAQPVAPATDTPADQPEKLSQ